MLKKSAGSATILNTVLCFAAAKIAAITAPIPYAVIIVKKNHLHCGIPNHKTAPAPKPRTNMAGTRWESDRYFRPAILYG